MELALTLTRFLMHLYLKKFILEVPNTMLEGVMDRAAMFCNYNRYLQIRCDIKGSQSIYSPDSWGLRMNRWITKHLVTFFYSFSRYHLRNLEPFSTGYSPNNKLSHILNRIKCKVQRWLNLWKFFTLVKKCAKSLSSTFPPSTSYEEKNRIKYIWA